MVEDSAHRMGSAFCKLDARGRTRGDNQLCSAALRYEVGTSERQKRICGSVRQLGSVYPEFQGQCDKPNAFDGDSASLCIVPRMSTGTERTRSYHKALMGKRWGNP